MARSHRRIKSREVAFRVAGMVALLVFVLIAPQIRGQVLGWLAAENSAQLAGMDYSTPLDSLPFLIDLVGGSGLEFDIIASAIVFVVVYALLLVLLGPRRSRPPSPPEERLKADFAAAMPNSLVDDDARFIPAWQLSAREFEYEVARVIERTTNLTAQVVGGAGDNGVDIRVMNGRTLVGVVQCKRYAPDKALPPQYVRELSAVKQKFGVNIAYLVTSAYFSNQSRADASSYGVKLMDGQQLEELRKREYANEVERVRRESTQKAVR